MPPFYCFSDYNINAALTVTAPNKQLVHAASAFEKFGGCISSNPPYPVTHLSPLTKEHLLVLRSYSGRSGLNSPYCSCRYAVFFVCLPPPLPLLSYLFMEAISLPLLGTHLPSIYVHDIITHNSAFVYIYSDIFSRHYYFISL